MLLFLALVATNNLLTTIIGILSNVAITLFAYLIRDQRLKDVRASITAHAIVNLALTLVYTALQLGVVIEDGAAMLFVIGPITEFNVSITRCLFTAFCFLLQVTIILLPISFLYRYALLCRKNRLLQVFTYRYFVPISIGLCAVLITFALLLQPFLAFWKSADISDVYQQFGDPILIGAESGQQKILMAFCVFLCIIAALSYAIIIFTARETFKMLSSTPLSDQTRKLQREMTIGMVLQAGLPIVFSTLPMICLIVLIISPIAIDCYGTFLFALLYWQPCI
uniref:G protein-coupled receptor n=1 Tax=Parascaris univalens TaxID=6257 RepID=A0A915BT76_PARUN